jgi:hypothetical protein
LEKELAVNYVTFYIGFCLLGLREESKLNFHLGNYFLAVTKQFWQEKELGKLGDEK